MRFHTLKTDRKNPASLRLLVTIILAAFLLFDLHILTDNSQLQNTSECLPTLKMERPDQLMPVRIPEKSAFQTEMFQKKEQTHGEESRLLIILLLFCLLSLYLLASGSHLTKHFSITLNLPHNRIIWFIHRKDGKGPKKISVS